MNTHYLSIFKLYTIPRGPIEAAKLVSTPGPLELHRLRHTWKQVCSTVKRSTHLEFHSHIFFHSNIYDLATRKLTSPGNMDYFKREWHLPTINCQGTCSILEGNYTLPRLQTCFFHTWNMSGLLDLRWVLWHLVFWPKWKMVCNVQQERQNVGPKNHLVLLSKIVKTQNPKHTLA